MSLQNIAAFPDTNLFMHFRPICEIDWRGLLQASCVEIKIALVVTRELEEQKTLNPSRKLRERAATSLRLLHGYLRQNQVREGVTLEFLINEPTTEFAVARGLNLQLGDDRLLGALFLFRDEHPDIPCTLVTTDLPLTVKATHYRVQLATPSEALRLPPEPDELEKKNRQLEAELLRYKSREPALAVLFEGDEEHLRFQIRRPSDEVLDSEATIQSMLAEAKAKCPLIERTAQRDSEATTLINPVAAAIAETMRTATEGLQAIGRQFQEDYNLRARTYYRDYEKYLRDSVEFKTLDTRTITLSLILSNTDTCPAEDIHVLLHFPDGFKLYDNEHIPEEPEEPSPPAREMNLLSNLSLSSSLPDIRLPQFRDRSLPRIRKTNSYDVTLEREKLQHGFDWPFAPLYVAFDSWESAKSFSIGYTVHAGNMIEDECGQLAVIIEKS